MADIKELIGLAALGVGAYFIYEWFFASTAATTPPATTGGSGSSAGGGAGTQTAPNTTGATGSGAGTTPTPAGSGSTPATTPFPLGPSGPCSFSGVLSPALTFAQKGNPNLNLGPSGSDTLTMDQWSYYLNDVCTGLSAQAGLDPAVIWPNDPNRGGGLNWNAFSGYAKGQGLSGPHAPIGTNIVIRYRRGRYAGRAA